MKRFGLLLLTLAVGNALASTPLPEFQERFAEHSQIVEPGLVEYRAENNVVRQELIHALLGDFANLTLDMRQLTADTWEIIENHEDIHDDCIDNVRDTFDYYVWIGELDIMYAAVDMDYIMRYDAEHRFHPWATLMGQENTRSISQTLQTLGRNRFLDDLTDTVHELEDELVYFENLWEGIQEILREEIEAMDPFAEMVREEMVWWHEYALYWHRVFMDWAIEDIDYYCVDD